MKRLLLGFLVALIACSRSANTIDGVVQDNSGRRVVAWVTAFSFALSSAAPLVAQP